MNSEPQHDPGYERRKARFKREYIKRKRKKRLIHNTIVIGIRILFVVLLLFIGFKIVDKIFLPLSETKKTQQVNKAQITAGTKETNQPQATSSGESADLLTLVNSQNPISEGYVPEVIECYPTIYVDVRMQKDLIALIDGARNAGYDLYVASGYRTAARQETLYKKQADPDKEGYSEHELGLAVDISSKEYLALDKGFSETAEYQWINSHCAEYGFVIRYPKGKEEVTGHEFEPYHLRYVGKKNAEALTAQGETLDEYEGSIKQ